MRSTNPLLIALFIAAMLVACGDTSEDPDTTGMNATANNDTMNDSPNNEMGDDDDGDEGQDNADDGMDDANNDMGVGDGMDEDEPDDMPDSMPDSMPSDMDELSVEELAAEDNVIFLDVRTEMEFASGHIPDAVNLPIADIASAPEVIGEDLSRPIITYCASGNRSARGLDALIDMGYMRVVDGGGVEALAETLGVELVR